MSELAAANPTERAQALLKLTERLTQLIREETRLFQAQPQGFAVAVNRTA